MSDNNFKHWVRERIIAWILTIIAFIAFFIWATSSEAQETGPVNEGHWSVPSDALIICPIFVDEVDPNVCLYIEDQWGPYPTEERCNRRLIQMSEVFPGLALMQSGVPHWSLIDKHCEIEGVDA